MVTRLATLASLSLALVAIPACTDPGGALDFGDPSGKGDSLGGGLRNLSGRTVHLADLDDPIAKLVLDAPQPPTAFADIIALLQTTDGNCQGGGSGMGVALVSETSQLLGKPDRFRAVFSRACSGRTPDKLFFSPQSSLTVDGPLPAEVEVMAFDERRGAYDFWAAEDDQWKFFGSSIDLLDGPGTGTGANQERRCARCHTGGGPIMKELTLPWANWDGPTGLHFNGGITSPGSTPLAAHLTDLLGLPAGSITKMTGDGLQGMVQAGNQRWNQTRLDVLGKRSIADRLRPLFCTVEINLLGAPDYRQPMALVPQNFLIDLDLNPSSPSAVITPTAYKHAIANAHQKVVDASGKQLKDDKGHLLRDTAFAFNHPHRSFADTDYVAQLKAAGVIDDAFAQAVLGVDFTTPVFSQPRCDLLRFAPTSGTDLKAGFIANLKAASPAPGSPEQQLLDGLDGTTTDLQQRVDAYMTACADRATADPEGLAADLIAILSLRRAEVRALPIFEHRELLPEDGLSTPAGAHLDPKTCALAPAP